MRSVRIVILLLVLLSLAAPVSAQDVQFEWERYDADLEVGRDGVMRVTETQEIRYSTSYAGRGGRKLEVDRVDDVSDIRVFELLPDGPQPLSPTTQLEGDVLNIAWRFSPGRAGDVRSFRLEYTVRGVVRSYEDVDVLRWQAVPHERRAPIRSSTVMLTLPGNVSSDQLKLESFPERLQGEEAPLPNGARYTIEDLPAFEGFEVAAEFPATLVTAAAPQWQQAADEQDRLNETVKPRNNVVLLGLGFLVPMVGLVGLLGLWFTKGKDPGVGRDAEVINTPPSDLPAPLVGVLLDERADVQDVISSITSLAERGVLRITQVENENLVGSNHDYRLDLVQPYDPHGLREYERVLINTLFTDADSALLSEVKGRFMAAIPAFRDQLYREVEQAGLFEGDPEKTRNYYRALGIGVALIGVMFGCLGGVLASNYASPFFVALPALGLIVVGIGLTQLARFMPVRTLNGAVEASRWRSFRNYLTHIERTPDLTEDKGAFERYLSYATAFGLGRSWLEKFAAVGTPAPAWYGQSIPGTVGGPDIGGMGTFGGRRGGGGVFGGPVIIVPPFGGYGGGGNHPGQGSGDSDIAGAGGGGLFDESGLFDFGGGQGTLDNASGGFGDLLDMASDAFGGGGWGGGGSGGFGGGSGGGGADFG